MIAWLVGCRRPHADNSSDVTLAYEVKCMFDQGLVEPVDKSRHWVRIAALRPIRIWQTGRDTQEGRAGLCVTM